MAGVTNGLILLLSALSTWSMAYGAVLQNSLKEPEPTLKVPQTPTQRFALKNSSLFLHCGINTTAKILDSWWLKNGIKMEKSEPNHFRTVNLDLEFEKLERHVDRNVSDDGRYRCVVKLEAGVVLGSIHIVSIAALENSKCSNSIFEGIWAQNVILPCCVKSVPPGNVKWTKVNGGDFDTNERFKQLYSGSLLILNLTKSDTGSYRCVVGNSFYRGVKEAAVSLIVQDDDSNFGPEILDTFASQLTMTSESESIDLFCAANGHPIPNVTWFTTFESNNQVHTKIVPSNSIMVSEGNHTCIASNGATQIAKSAVVRYPPSFENPPHQICPLARTIRFTCRSPVGRSPTIWYKDGELLHTTGRVKHRVDELIINNIIQTDSGYYQCESQDYIGTGRLSIEPPKEILEVPASLNCDPISPTQILVKWGLPAGRSIQAFTIHYTPADGGEERQWVTKNNTLLIEGLHPNTKMSIYVRSYSGNSASSQSEHVFCTTLEDSPTASPTLLHVSQVGPPSQYRLRWKRLAKEEARGTILHYKLQWRVSDGSFSNVQILHGDSEEFIITGLQADTHYSLRISPATSKGYPLEVLPWTNFETGNSNATFTPPELKVETNASAVIAMWQYEFDSIAEMDDDGIGSGFRLLFGQMDDSIGDMFYRPIIYLGPKEQNYTFHELNPGTQFTVSLQAFTGKWESLLTTKIVHTERADSATSVIPNTVTIQNLEARPISPTEIMLSWSRSNTAEVGQYVLRFKSVGAGDVLFSQLKSTNESLLVRNLKPFTSYEFDVAFEANGTCGPFSHKVEAVTLQGTPGPPVQLQFQVLNKTSIELTWRPPLDSNGVIQGYLVELANDSAQEPSQFNTTENQLTLHDLQQNKEYIIRIAAITFAGPGEFSIYIYPKIFSANGTRAGENGATVPGRKENNNNNSNTASSSVSSGSSQRQLGLILGVVLSLISIITCSLIIIWRNSCFSFIVNRGRRPRMTTHMNGGIEKDTVDSAGVEMMTMKSTRNSQSFLDTKGGHRTVIVAENVSEPLLMPIQNPEQRAEESERGSDREEINHREAQD